MTKAGLTPTGKLVLMPNTLDFGCDPGSAPCIQTALPQAVIEQAAQIKHWVAENAKTTRAFLKRVNEVTPLVQPLQTIGIVELPRAPKGQPHSLPQDMKPLLAPAWAGHDIGLISEAGLPAVADPGAALVQAAHAAGVDVEVLCGPSALLLALAASGLHGQCFAFVGYLPVNEGQRAARLRELESISRKNQQTQLLIETPYRNAALWSGLISQLQPSTRLSVSCGLTLPGGFSLTRTVAQWRQHSLQLQNDRPAVFCFLADA
jgi:16S rRNA (cytidine1402-2'-O)-methyltransferase